MAELARDVVQHLARPRGQEGREAHHFEAIAPAPEAVARLCDLLIQPTAAEAIALVEAERARGVTRQGIIYGHLAPAARLLGDRWEEDAITFLDVTRGAGHLYALIRALRSDAGAMRMADDRHSALFASTPGETHHLGISIAADTFREEGWEIDLQLGATHDDLLAHVEATRPAVIGLSLSTRGRLADLIRLVVALRLLLPGTLIGVAPPAAMEEDEVFKLVDVELVFRDARQAFDDLERLKRHRV